MKPNNIDKILFITLSNIGDVILTLPVLSALNQNFPDKKIDVVVGPRPQEIFSKDPRVGRIFVYDKHADLKRKINLIKELRSQKYDLAVDMRGSLIPFLIGAKNRKGLFSINRSTPFHKRLVHLNKLKKLGIEYKEEPSIYIDTKDRDAITKLLEDKGCKIGEILIGVSPSCRSTLKQWTYEGFVEVIKNLLKQKNCRIVLIGDANGVDLSDRIKDAIKDEGIIDLTGKINLNELFALIEKMQVLLTCDSACMHIASDIGTKVVAIFGPTDPKEYGPRGAHDIVIRKAIKCSPCKKALCSFNSRECMKQIRPGEVLEAVKSLLKKKRGTEPYFSQSIEYGGKKIGLRPPFLRILIVRTDRIGDVVLSTPVIEAARKAFPDAFIAMMTSPQTKEIIVQNPYLNEVIIYDKKLKHRSIFKTLSFSKWLKKKRFDLALILHSTNRVNIICFLAGIPKRVGYARGKMDCLLIDALPYEKRLGQKHESEYSMDVLRSLGIDVKTPQPIVPITKENKINIDNLLKGCELKEGQAFAVIHPGASCISKRWPVANFARLADILIERFGMKVALISSPSQIEIGKNVKDLMKNNTLFLCGRTSLGELAALFKRASLFISNDSGPVHIACAVGTPSVSIFGRNEAGLSPARWRGLGPKSVALHKEVGCAKCLAHNCRRNFLCLRSITVEAVIKETGRLLKKPR